MAEKYPLGRLLWLAVCDARKVPQDRAELEWRDWDGDFMTKGEWQQAAEKFLNAAAHAASSSDQLTVTVLTGPHPSEPMQPGDLGVISAADQQEGGV